MSAHGFPGCAMNCHTQAPWDVIPSTENHGPYVVSEWGSTICDCYEMSNPSALAVCNGGNSKPVHFMGDEADGNAAFIVLAVNAHDELVAVLKRVRALYLPLDCEREIDAALAKAGAQ